MKIIDPTVQLEQEIDSCKVMEHIERAGRVCYKSEDQMEEGSADKFIRSIIRSGHESVIEHISITFKIICDRGVSHEIVRHRIASYSQESTRFCNYSKDKFGNEITVVRPLFWDQSSPQYILWKRTMEMIETTYFQMINDYNSTPEEARSILPNSLKTEIFVTMNLREWRHFLKCRTNKKAHPQIRQIALMIYDILVDKLPVVFEDIDVE
jgi:thymidylate synthase (FAD)